MPTYTATLSHYDIARAREIECGDDLTTAKRRATREFGTDYQSYDIIIIAHYEDRAPEVVASRRIGSPRWRTHVR
jgi:hypothetical protein